jgi:hypothetical protein
VCGPWRSAAEKRRGRRGAVTGSGAGQERLRPAPNRPLREASDDVLAVPESVLARRRRGVMQRVCSVEAALGVCILAWN